MIMMQEVTAPVSAECRVTVRGELASVIIIIVCTLRAAILQIFSAGSRLAARWELASSIIFILWAAVRPAAAASFGWVSSDGARDSELAGFIIIICTP
jgi:hypothetical protein